MEKKYNSNKRAVNSDNEKDHKTYSKSGVWQMTLAVLSTLCLKFGANIKEMGWLKKGKHTSRQRKASVSI